MECHRDFGHRSRGMPRTWLRHRARLHEDDGTGPVTRGIDMVKKTRGESTTTMNSLRMKPGAEKLGTEKAKAKAPLVPATLKLK